MPWTVDAIHQAVRKHHVLTEEKIASAEDFLIAIHYTWKTLQQFQQQVIELRARVIALRQRVDQACIEDSLH